MCSFKDDWTYGVEAEKIILPFLNKYYECNARETKPYSVFDFKDKDKKIIIELKSRKIHSDKYYSTMIGLNKIRKGLSKYKKGYRVLFIFKFIDCLCSYELKKDVPYEWIRKGGRTDRGYNEIKDYVYIPVHKLKKIKRS